MAQRAAGRVDQHRVHKGDQVTDKHYREFIRARGASQVAEGIDASALNPALFAHQRALVEWALRRGRAAIFADTGLGKTIMQCEWARVVQQHTDGNVLIVAPLAVADQTVREAARFGIPVTYSRTGEMATPITITNYDMLEAFDGVPMAGVVLDESSILKSFNGATRNQLIERFAATRFRLACTATPAPNDHVELGNHSEFLGIKSRVEMLAEYFAHDGGSTQDWRLKGHARDTFWRWVCEWGAVVTRPSDLGFADDGFALPALLMEAMVIDVDHIASRTDGLFADDAVTLNDQRKVRRDTMVERVSTIAEHINAHDRPALVWCDLNDESAMLRAAIPDAVEVKGADTHDHKRDALLGFAEGRYRVLITKPSIAGFGMNWQHCRDMYFTGPSHSYEQTYQAIRRCWRFGQTQPVTVRTCVAESERAIVANMRRKEDGNHEMQASMVAAMREMKDVIVKRAKREWNNYTPNTKMRIPTWIA